MIVPSSARNLVAATAVAAICASGICTAASVPQIDFAQQQQQQQQQQQPLDSAQLGVTLMDPTVNAGQPAPQVHTSWGNMNVQTSWGNNVPTTTPSQTQQAPHDAHPSLVNVPSSIPAMQPAPTGVQALPVVVDPNQNAAQLGAVDGIQQQQQLNGAPASILHEPIINDDLANTNFRYKVEVWTSDVFTAGTDADVQVGFQSKKRPNWDQGFTLNNDHNNFERNSHDTFHVDSRVGYDDFQGICVGVVNSDWGGDAWHCNRVEVRFEGQHNLPYKGLRLKVNAWLEKDSTHGHMAVTCCGRGSQKQAACEWIQ